MNKSAILVAISGLLFTGAAQAADLTGNIGMGVQSGVNFAMGPSSFATKADPDLTLGFWVKNGFTENLALAFSYDNIYFRRADVRLQPQLLTAYYQFNPRSIYNPNVHLGSGLVLVGPAETHNRTAFGLTAGVGEDLYISKHLSVGVSADYLFVAARNERIYGDLHVGMVSLKIGFWPVTVTEDAQSSVVQADPLNPSDPEAQFNLGLKYYSGQDGIRNISEAVEWYRRSAEQGYPPAQLYLGMIYSNNNDGMENYPEAVKWLTKAAEKGYPKAQYNLGVIYNNGSGVEKDYAEAYKWFSLAAAKGKSEAVVARDSAGSMLTQEERDAINYSIQNIAAQE